MFTISQYQWGPEILELFLQVKTYLVYQQEISDREKVQVKSITEV
jgi:hypothetical protein